MHYPKEKMPTEATKICQCSRVKISAEDLFWNSRAIIFRDLGLLVKTRFQNLDLTKSWHSSADFILWTYSTSYSKKYHKPNFLISWYISWKIKHLGWLISRSEKPRFVFIGLKILVSFSSNYTFDLQYQIQKVLFVSIERFPTKSLTLIRAILKACAYQR